jgi:hypothetical protein
LQLLQDFSFYESLEQQKSLQQHAEAARQPTAHLPSVLHSPFTIAQAHDG